MSSSEGNITLKLEGNPSCFMSSALSTDSRMAAQKLKLEEDMFFKTGSGTKRGRKAKTLEVKCQERGEQGKWITLQKFFERMQNEMLIFKKISICFFVKTCSQ